MVELYKILSILIKYKTESLGADYIKHECQIVGMLFNYFKALGIQIPQQEKYNISTILLDWAYDFRKLIQQKKELE